MKLLALSLLSETNIWITLLGAWQGGFKQFYLTGHPNLNFEKGKILNNKFVFCLFPYLIKKRNNKIEKYIIEGFFYNVEGVFTTLIMGLSWTLEF